MSSLRRIIQEAQNVSPFNSTDVLTPGRVSLRKKEKGSNRVGNNVEVTELALTTINGERISLLGYYRSLSFDESIFSASIAGAITIFDTEGAFEKFAIRGGEKLSIKIENSVSTKLIVFREDLIVSKIEANEFDALSLTNSYLLHFSSRSFVNSLKKRHFKSYTGDLAETVYSIYKEMSQNDLLIENPKITIPQDKPYICTGKMPHTALMQLADESSVNDKLFVFFERTFPVFGNYSDGTPFTATHYFGSIQKLIDDANVNGAPTIVFSVKDDARFEGAEIRASNLKPLPNHTHVPATALGLYSSELSFINPITREYQTQNLSYVSDDVHDFYDNKLIDRQNIFSVGEEQKHKRVQISSISNFSNIEEWLKNKVLLNMSANYYKISIDIQGSTNEIGAGHVVNFLFPSRVDKILNPGHTSMTIDPILSGRYLVNEVKHYISGNSYVKRLILSRGSSPYNFETRTVTDPAFREFLSLANINIDFN
jgi:hypothetical protein